MSAVSTIVSRLVFPLTDPLRSSDSPQITSALQKIAVLLAITASLLSSCARNARSASTLRRLAIPPAAVLIGDRQAAWMGLASSIVLQQDLAISRNILPLFAADQSGAYLSGATEILRLTVERRGSNLRLSGATYDLSTQRTVKTFTAESGETGNLLAPAEAIARQLGSEPLERFSTTSSAALKPFVEAAAAQDPQSRAQLLQTSLSVDPSFGLARIALAETIGQAAMSNVDDSRFQPLDRLRWNALKLRLSNAPPPQQIHAQKAVLELAPHNVDALAALASLEYLSGDRASAERSLKTAVALNPANLVLQFQLQRLTGQNTPK